MKVKVPVKTYDNLPTSHRTIIVLLVGVLLFPFNIFSATLAFDEKAVQDALKDVRASIENPLDKENGAGGSFRDNFEDPTQPMPVDTTLLAKEIPDSVVLGRQSLEIQDSARLGRQPLGLPDSILLGRQPLELPADVVSEEFTTTGDSLRIVATDTVPVDYDDWVLRPVEFSPNPTRAVWLSALFPGLGQIYNRRYWKLPIIVGGYMGLIYATSWNNTMLEDYTRAYADIMDNDPSTKSYMDFFPPTVKEENLDKTWLTSTLKNKKDYFRRNRDLCVICMVGVYLLAMVDAYVDASLSHFDISPDLSMDVTPTVFQDTRSRIPAVGINWAFNF